MKTLDDLTKDAALLCREIENLPGGEQQTKVSVMAAQLAADIREASLWESAQPRTAFGNPPTKIYYHCKSCLRLFEIVCGLVVVIDRLPSEINGFQMVHDYACGLPNCKTFHAAADIHGTIFDHAH